MSSNKKYICPHRKAWLQTHGIEKYEILSDGSMDVFDNVYLRKNLNMKLPYTFNIVYGSFKLEECTLQSLYEFPKKVTKDLVLYACCIHSLKGMTTHVGGSLDITLCNILDISGIPVLVNKPGYNTSYNSDGANFMNNRIAPNEVNFKALYEAIKDTLNDDIFIRCGLDFDTQFKEWVFQYNRMETINEIINGEE